MDQSPEKVEKFKKRSGTINKGHFYDNLVMAHLTLKLLMKPEVEHFCIAQYNENFGLFDDIIFEVKLKGMPEQQYALQLKHSNRKCLIVDQFKEKKGNFSILKYLRSYEAIKHSIKSHKLILFTNLSLPDRKYTTFKLEENTKYLEVRIVRCESEFMIRSTEDENCCFRFEILNDDKNEYKSFFENFFIYDNQKNVDGLKRNIAKMLKENFHSDNVDKYIHFISSWNEKSGKKNNLEKEWLSEAISLLLLKEYIKPLSFEKCSWTSDTMNKIALLRKIISAFDLIAFQSSSYEGLKRVWSNERNVEFSDEKWEEIKRKCANYQLSPKNIKQKDEVDDMLFTKILWIMENVPLIVADNATYHKVIPLFRGKGIIILQDDKTTNAPDMFPNLSTVQKDQRLYEEMLQTFTCSIQGEKTVLDSFIKRSEEIIKLLTFDDLLAMANDSFIVGESVEPPNKPYIQRLLKQDNLSQPQTEDDLIKLDSGSKICLITGEPGLGKTTMLKSLRSKYPREYWIILIQPKYVHRFYKEAPEKSLIEFIVDLKLSKLKKVDREYFQTLLKENKVVYMWDGLDEVDQKYLKSVEDVICEISRTPVTQYVTSRSYLDERLQKKFKVTPWKIVPFTQADQKEYIKQYFQPDVTKGLQKIETIFGKIETIFGTVNYSQVLKIPLHMFLLMKLFLDKHACDSSDFTLVDVYDKFIEEKFKIFYKGRAVVDCGKPHSELVVKFFQDMTIKRYEKAALKTLKLHKSLQVSVDNTLEKIRPNCTSIGLITKISDQTPNFFDESFAEYLVARYILRRPEFKDAVLSDPKYKNIGNFVGLLTKSGSS